MTIGKPPRGLKYNDFRAWYFDQEESGGVGEFSKAWREYKEAGRSPASGSSKPKPGRRHTSDDPGSGPSDKVDLVDPGDSGASSGARGADPAPSANTDSNDERAGEEAIKKPGAVSFEGQSVGEIVKVKPEKRLNVDDLAESGDDRKAESIEIGPSTSVTQYAKLISKIHHAIARWVEKSTEGQVVIEADELRDLDDSGGAVLAKYDSSGWLRKIGQELAYAFGWVIVAWRWVDAKTELKKAEGASQDEPTREDREISPDQEDGDVPQWQKIEQNRKKSSI